MSTDRSLIDLGPIGTAWRVDGGDVDIFFQPAPGRRRRFLFRLTLGEYIVSPGPSGDGPTLWVVPRKEAKLCPHILDAEVLESWFAHWVPPLLPAADGWPTQLGPSPAKLHPGQTARGPSGSAGEVILHSGSARLWGIHNLGLGAHPLGPGAWITAGDGGAELSFAKINAVEPASLSSFFAAAFGVLTNYSHQEGQDSQKALDQIEEENHHNLLSAVAELRRLDEKDPVTTEFQNLPSARNDDHALTEAFARLHHLSHANWTRAQAERLKKVPVQKGYANAPERVNRILKSLGIGGRAVRLDDAFWRNEGPPLLAWLGADGAIGVLHWHDGGWVYETGGRSRRISRKDRKDFLPSATQIYPWPREEMTSLYAAMRYAIMGGSADRGRMLLAICIVSLAGMVTPFFLHTIMDRVIPQGNRMLLAVLIGALVVMAATQAIFDLTMKLTSARIAARVELRSQPFAMQRLLRLPLTYFRAQNSGDLLDRALSLNGAREILTGSAAMFVLSAPLALLGTAPLMFYDPALAIAGVALALLGALLQAGLSLPIQSHNRQGFQVQGQVENVALQLFRGIAKLKVTAAEPRAMSRWAKAYAKLRKSRMGAQKWSVIQNATSEIVTQGSFAILLAVAAWRNGMLFAASDSPAPEISPADFVAFAAAFGIVSSAGKTAAQALVNVLEGLSLAKRASPIFEEKIEPQTDQIVPPRLSGAIDVRGISFRPFADGPMILDNVSLTIPAGAKVAIVGPSGSGKSTLLRILLGLDRPETGEVLLDGMPMDRLDPSTLREQMGAVLQDGKISAGSILDNISGDRVLGIHDAWEAVRRVGLDRDIQAMPMGLHTRLLDGSSTLSGGQKQRVLIARAIAGSPAIMVLDEATSALDNRLQAQVMDTLRQMSVTRIVVAHRLSTIRDADVIHVMSQGRIVQTGTFDQLSKEEGPFRQMTLRQTL